MRLKQNKYEIKGNFITHEVKLIIGFAYARTITQVHKFVSSPAHLID